MGERRRRNKQLARNGGGSGAEQNREEDLHAALAQQMKAKRDRENVRFIYFNCLQTKSLK